MATNYDNQLDKGDVLDVLESLALPDDIVARIFQNLGSLVNVEELNSTPTEADFHGKDLVLMNTGGTVDLSNISKADIKDLDALIFTTDENVNVDLSGLETTHFKGVITTNGGDDSITVNSEKGGTVSSGDGDDTVNTGAGKDFVKTGAGNDSVDTGAGNDTVYAGAGDDSINTGTGCDTVYSQDGNDTVNTGDGHDIVFSGAGNDSVVAGVGNDIVFAGAGNDTVYAGAGNDSISAGAGDDYVSTGLGDDSVSTGIGNDSVYVGFGNDSVNTGAGDDIVKLATGFSGTTQFNGGEGSSDILDLSHVVITDVVMNCEALTITLDDNSVISATNFETFIYDSSTVDVDGGIVTVGVNPFDANF